MSGQGDRPEPGRYWLDQPANIQKLEWLLAALCLMLLIVDFLVVRHGEIPLAGSFGFFAWFGFLAYVGLIFVAKALRLLLMRPERYYEPDDQPD